MVPFFFFLGHPVLIEADLMTVESMLLKSLIARITPNSKRFHHSWIKKKTSFNQLTFDVVITVDRFMCRKQILLFDMFCAGKVKSYLKNRKWDEANDLAKLRYEQESHLHAAPALVQYYVTLLQNESPLKASEIKDELIAKLTNVSTSAKEVEKYANNLRNNDRPYEALLFYQLAIHYCGDERNISDIVNVQLRCCAGTSVVVREAIEKAELSKQVVIRHVVPYMKQAKAGIARHLLANRREVSHALATCLHCIEQVQKEVDDYAGREASLKEAISLLRDNFGRDVQSKKIFGTCLNNLGHTYLLQHRFNDAIRLFQEAITAKQKAEDYDTPAEKREDVLLSQKGLKVARARDCVIQ